MDEGFEHRVVALNRGGKRDHGTWFSAEPAAVLGLLLIPRGPASTYLGRDPARIGPAVAEATGGSYEQEFGDYLLMCSALAGADQRSVALVEARTLDQQWTDDASSRAHLLVRLMTTGR